MIFSPRLLPTAALAVLLLAPSVRADLVEISGGSTIVGLSGSAPAAIFVEEDRATLLTVTGVFDPSRTAIEQNESSATYAALYAVGTIDGTEVPLSNAQLTIWRDVDNSAFGYRFSGYTVEGWLFLFHGYGEDPAFVPSLALPTADLPEGDWYYKWDIDLVGPASAWHAYSDGASCAIRPMDEPGTAVEAPAIRRHPSHQKARRGSVAHFRVKVAGAAGVSYQWFKDDQPIAGAQAEKLTIKRLQRADAGQYHVEVMRDGATARSKSARLVVR